MSDLKDRRASARMYLDKLCKDGPGPPPPEEIRLRQLDDGRVRACWNYGRRLTDAEFMILSFHRGNQIFVNLDGLCFGFEGDDADYHDYTKEAGARYE